MHLKGFEFIMKHFYKIMVVCLCMAMLVPAVGCGSKKEQEGIQDGQAVDMKELREAMLAADTTLPEMKVSTSEDEKGELNFTVFSDFDYERVQSYFYAYAAKGGPQEIAVVELKEAGDAAALMNTLQDHIEMREGALGEYAPDQLAMVEHAVIKQYGRYVAMIIAEKSGLVQQACGDMM